MINRQNDNENIGVDKFLKDLSGFKKIQLNKKTRDEILKGVGQRTAEGYSAPSLADSVSCHGRWQDAWCRLVGGIGNKTLTYSVAGLLIAGSLSAVGLYAERSLPGDKLYGVKTGITEPIRGLVAVTVYGRAKWEAQILTRRIEEAENLALEGKLSPAVWERVDTSITSSDQKLRGLLEEIETKSGKSVSAGLLSEMEGTLEAHIYISEKIVGTSSDGTINTKGLKKALEEKSSGVNRLRLEKEEDFLSEVSEKSGSEKEDSDITEQFNNTRKRIKSLRSTQKEGQNPDLENVSERAKESIDKAKTAVEAEEKSEAYRLIFEANREAKKAETIIENKEKLNKNTGNGQPEWVGKKVDKIPEPESKGNGKKDFEDKGKAFNGKVK